MEKDIKSNDVVKKENAAAKTTVKYEGVAASLFKIKKRTYVKGDSFSTNDKASYDYLISKGIINHKNDKKL